VKIKTLYTCCEQVGRRGRDYERKRNLTYYKLKHRNFLLASKEIGLEVNAEKAKYMVMSRNHNAGHNHNIKMGNKSFERVEGFKYFKKIITN
jgi:hypothetical protein